MKIGQHGVYFEGMYCQAAPGVTVSRFVDEDGATFFIDTITLLRMAELVKFDLERWNKLEYVMEQLNK